MLFDKVTKRIQDLCSSLEVQADKVAQKVFVSMYDGIKTSEIDDLSADVAVHMLTDHPDYETLATRIVVSNMHKNSPKCFSDAMLELYTLNRVSKEFMKCVLLELDSEIVHERDYDFSYFGLKTLQKMYLGPGETPQYMYMRVAVGIHGSDIERVKETYHLMSQHYFTDRKSTRLNSSHVSESRMPSSA